MIIFNVTAFAQNEIYTTSWNKDRAIMGGGLALLAIDLAIHNASKPLTEADINLLDMSKLNGFDRKATNYYSLGAQNASDICRTFTSVLPLSLLAFKPIRKEGWTIGLLYLETTLVNNAVTSFSKVIFQRTRPYAYNPDVPLDTKLTKKAKRSFYSGHVSQTASISFFTAKVFSDFYPDSSWKPIVWTVACLLPVTAGYLRVKGGQHFPSDVIVGSLMGAAVGYLIPTLHKQNENAKISLYYNSQVNGLSLTFALN